MKIRSPLARYLTLLLLWLFFAQTIGAGPHLSLTADEPVHMAQGYVYWTRGDFRLQRPVAQPPLPDLLPGVFLILQPGPEVEEIAGWQSANLSQFARAFAAWYGQKGTLHAATFVSRAPIALMAVLGVAIAYRWTKGLFGIKGGLFAVTLLACDPNFIAHAGLATTDVLLAVWTFVAVYSTTQWIKSQGTWFWGLLTGVALGLALGSKTSGFFAAGMVGLLLGLHVLGGLIGGRIEVSDLLTETLIWGQRFVLALGIAFFVLWGLYRFELRALPGLSVPVPFATHWVIWKEMRTHLREGHIAYLLGETRYTGWWFYYPLAFLLKTPLPTLVLLLGSGIWGLTRAPRRWWKRHDLWLAPLLYAVAAVNSHIDIGYRYLLVMLPFLYVLCGGGLARLQRRWQQMLLTALLLWLSVGTVSAFPHYLAYFNPLTQGPRDATNYLVDSNLDWGQGFIALRRWIEKHEVQAPLFISYYTFVDPAYYGLTYTPIAPAPDAPPVLEQRFDPKPGTYAISATPLQGVMVAQEETYSWFRQREPRAYPSGAIFVYEIPAGRARPQWIAQCTTPVVPLTQGAIEEGFGRTDLRHVTFDCTQSWVYPAGGRSLGQYALFRETAVSGDAFLTRRLREMRLSYEQKHTGILPSFRLYERAPGDVAPRHAPEEPIQVGEVLFFRGYTLVDEEVQSDDMLIVETYWEVRARAFETLSIMLHLLGPEGTPAVVGDGLGFPISQWQPGDVFIQKHILALPTDAPAGEYTIYTGAYDLKTVTPYPIHSSDKTIGERLHLTTLHIP
ncbi:MAG: ArnT family glycosyltransferase [Anaerolineae bacterium]